jgi:hypothetical protein
MFVALFQSPPPWWDVAWWTIGLVLVGAGGVIVAVCTLVTIKRQTDAIQRQVQQMGDTATQTDRLIEESTKQSLAAKKSADALVAAERAWIDGEFFRIPTQGTHSWSYKLKIVNQGKTPAQLVRCGVSMKTHGHTAGNHPLLRDETLSINISGLLSAGGELILAQTISLPDHFKNFAEHLAGNETGVFEVTIGYMDVIAGEKITHETVVAYYADKGALSKIFAQSRYT